MITWNDKSENLQKLHLSKCLSQLQFEHASRLINELKYESMMHSLREFRLFWQNVHASFLLCSTFLKYKISELLFTLIMTSFKTEISSSLWYQQTVCLMSCIIIFLAILKSLYIRSCLCFLSIFSTRISCSSDMQIAMNISLIESM